MEKAIEAYTYAIQQNPTLPEAFCNRAVVRIALLDYTGAMHDLDSAIALDHTSYELYTNRGDLKQMMGDLAGAIDDYHRARHGGKGRVIWD
jgi:tetratricopeptide (TPR) repeat protein